MLYTVRLVKLPPAVKGLVLRDAEDFNNIYINENLDPEQQKKALLHELNHIEQQDFDNSLTIPEIE